MNEHKVTMSCLTYCGDDDDDYDDDYVDDDDRL